MAYEIEITGISDGWIQGRVVNPVNEIRFVSVQIEFLVPPPGHVFRRGQRLDQVSDLRVGDAVMCEA